ncbi:hypothetical protein SAMN04515672_1432 [Natronorubrum texcoconense]|uniref:Uncharacterized protein n=2 Tax=Natronorubrum texcoconense TaxID=1095776 RepID=A0A1G8VP33_9EURY|nr:hypothetical protein SAMN04515672_1432 [Natronorubrum texcoconense]
MVQGVTVPKPKATTLTEDHANGQPGNPATDMTTTDFSWGTITHQTDPESGDTNVEILAESEGRISLSVTTAANVADAPPAERADTDAEAETATFPWGVVVHTPDADAGTTTIEVITDAEADVSVSMRAVSDSETHSESTTVVQSSADATANVTQSTTSSTTSSVVTQSTTNTSQSTNISSGTSIDIDDGDDD